MSSEQGGSGGWAKIFANVAAKSAAADAAVACRYADQWAAGQHTTAPAFDGTDDTANAADAEDARNAPIAAANAVVNTKSVGAGVCTGIAAAAASGNDPATERH